MTTIKLSFTIVLIFSLFTLSLGQTTRPAPGQGSSPAQPARQQTKPERQDEDEVVRITTSLVQVDAVVTDASGQQVTDLTADDFEIREDNRPQKITNFSYVPTAGARLGQPAPARTTSGSAPPLPPAVVGPDQVRRTVALVVDDFGLTPGSVNAVRQGLRKFVDEEMQQGDMVAIVATSGNLGGLQQFTSDKRILHAAIDRVRWSARSRGQPEQTAPGMSDQMLAMVDNLGQFRDELFTVGTLGALNYTVRGMREMPGRKSVILFSEGFKIWLTNAVRLDMNNPDVKIDRDVIVERTLRSLERLTDLANRSSVVIYTINASGLKTYMEDASADLSQLDLLKSGPGFADRLANARVDSFDSQSGLNYLAQQTGGFAVQNTNDLAQGIRRVLDDQKGYYLIAYRPEASTFAPGDKGYKRFHKIVVKMRRPGLKVRSRTGFYGVPDELAHPPVPHTRNAQLISALDSPFKATGVDLRMTSLFANSADAGSFMRTLLHINARDLTFTDEPDGWHSSIFDVLAVTFGDSGQVFNEMGRTYTVRLSDKTYRRIMERGFDYMITVPVEKPGAYQLRVSLRDAASERLGSASEFIEVPDLMKNRLALSGIILSGTETAAAGQTANAAQPQAGENAQTSAEALARPAEGQVAESDAQSGPALRRLRPGMTLRYNYIIYNSQLDRATGRPQLTTQMRLFRGGRQVFEGSRQPLDASGQPDLKRISVGSGLILGQQFPSGEYVLQVTVTDNLAPGKENAATAWIDFEIVR